MKYIFALLLNSVFADQPVHCFREEIYGLWEFHVSTQIEEVDLFKT